MSCGSSCHRTCSFHFKTSMPLVSPYSDSPAYAKSLPFATLSSCTCSSRATSNAEWKDTISLRRSCLYRSSRLTTVVVGFRRKGCKIGISILRSIVTSSPLGPSGSSGSSESSESKGRLRYPSLLSCLVLVAFGSRGIIDPGKSRPCFIGSSKSSSFSCFTQFYRWRFLPLPWLQRP